MRSLQNISLICLFSNSIGNIRVFKVTPQAYFLQHLSEQNLKRTTKLVLIPRWK